MIISHAKPTSQTPCDEWTFWQFADHARIPGIRGPVDLNVYCSDVEHFALFSSDGH